MGQGVIAQPGIDSGVRLGTISHFCVSLQNVMGNADLVGCFNILIQDMSLSDILGEGLDMKTITLRNIDPELEKALTEKAELESISLNSVVLRVLQEAFGLRKRPRRERNPQLEELAGSWSEEDQAEFEKNTVAFNKVDEVLWQ